MATRTILDCSRCGEGVCSIVPPTLDTSANFAMRKMMRALGAEAFSFDALLDPATIASTFSLLCPECTSAALNAEKSSA